MCRIEDCLSLLPNLVEDSSKQDGHADDLDAVLFGLTS